MLPSSVQTAWDEPDGIPARGTLVVLTGRGETAAAWARFGRRLSFDAWRVRVVLTDLDDLDATTAAVTDLIDDPTLPGPRVIVGTDAGAFLAARLLETTGAEGAILAGLALEPAPAPASFEDELDARTSCPNHRRLLTGDDGFTRGALSEPLPWRPEDLPTPTKPVLVIHGSLDPVTPAAEVVAAYHGTDAQVRLINGGRHDILNDAMHRVVAATVVLFIEQLKLGAGAPTQVVAR